MALRLSSGELMVMLAVDLPAIFVDVRRRLFAVAVTSPPPNADVIGICEIHRMLVGHLDEESLERQPFYQGGVLNHVVHAHSL